MPPLSEALAYKIWFVPLLWVYLSYVWPLINLTAYTQKLKPDYFHVEKLHVTLQPVKKTTNTSKHYYSFFLSKFTHLQDKIKYTCIYNEANVKTKTRGSQEPSLTWFSIWLLNFLKNFIRFFVSCHWNFC